MLHLTSRAAWGWPTGLEHNFEILLSKNNHQAQERPSSFGDRYCLSFKSMKVLVTQVSVGCFKPTKKREKLLGTSYVRGPNFNGSSTKCHVLRSSNLSSQCQGYYKGYIWWALRNLSPRDSTHKNASEPSYVSHRMSPTSPRKTRSKKKLQIYKNSKSRLCSPESKYAWNKIIVKQMKSDPFVNLHGFSLERPKGNVAWLV